MKKLLIALTAAVAGVFASTATADDALPTGVGFDDVAAETSLVIDGYWTDSTDAGATKVVKAWGENEWPEGINHPQKAGNPDSNYLSLKTAFGNPIFRKAFASGAPTVTGDKIFFDSMVKFTATDAEPEMTAYTGSKLIVYVKDNSEDDSTAAYTTNLMVVANNAAGEPTTYDLGNIDVDVWHRLTIKAVKAFTGSSALAFTVYVDEQSKAVDTPIYTDTSSLTTTAKGINAECRLFPSLESCQTITEVGFDGQGCIDDLVFADNLGDETWADEHAFTITKDENITSFTWTCKSGSTVIDSDTATDTVVIPAVKDMTVEISNPVFVAGQWELAADVSGCNFEKGVFSGFDESSTSAKLVANDVTPRVSVKIGEGDPQTFPSVGKAIEAINALEFGAVTLAFDKTYYADGVDLGFITDAAGDHTEATFTTAAEVTLDLAGCTITGCAGIAEYVIESASALTIVDTVGGGKIVPNTGNTGAVIVYDNDLAIAGGTFDGAVDVGGENPGDVTITGGKFDYLTNKKDDADAFKFELTEDYVVTKDSEEDPKYWVVSPAPKAGVILTTTHATVEGVKTGDEFAKDGVIKFTVEPEEYYDMPTVTVGESKVFPDEDGNCTYTVTAADVEGETLNISVVATATQWTITYYDEGEEVFAEDTYTIENRMTKELNAGTRAGYKFVKWEDDDFNEITSLAEKTGDIDLYGTWTLDAFVAKIGDTTYDTFAAALKAAKSGDTITLGQDINEPGIALAVSQFPGAGLTIDLNNHTYTFTKDATGKYVKDCVTIQTNDVVTIKNGTIAVAAKQGDTETDTNFRDVIRLYGNADSTLNLVNVKFDGTNLKALDPETKPVCVFSIEGGWFNIDADSEIDAGPATYAIKLGNHANATQYEVMTLTNAGTVKGDILITGGTYVEEGASVDGTYWYGKNAYSTWADGVTSTLFAARIGGEPAEGEEDCACGKLYKTLAAAAAAANAGDIVTIAKAGAFEEATVEFAAAATFVVGSLADVTVGTLTLNGTKISLAEGGKLTNAGDIAGSIITSYTKVENTYTGSKISPVVPGDPITTGDPATLANLINTDASVKAQYFKAPEGANVGASYAAMFVAAPDGNAVKFVLTPAAEAELQANANGEIVKIKPDEIAALTGESGEFKVETTIPGFYYAVKQGNGIGNMKVVEAGVLATDDKGVNLLFKKYDGAGFYSIVVSEKAIPAEK